MTKEQAIDNLKLSAKYCVVPTVEALNMAIKALEQNTVSQETYDSEYLARKQAEQKLYEIEQNTSDDCVSRAEALSGIRNLYPGTPVVRLNLKKWQKQNKKYFECEDIIKALPPVKNTRKVGKWIGEEEGYYSECSCCGASFLWEDYKCIGDWNYCPKCGAEFER